MVKCAVATCWEEGPKAYHTCNNSGYTLCDGGPWAPWIPAKQNTHAPAANKEEDRDVYKRQVYMKRIRAKLGEAVIKTVKGIGYRVDSDEAL